MDVHSIEKLLHEDESASLDFKREQYRFIGADDNDKSELLKDILAFANAWRRDDAYILIGVEEVKGGRSRPIGLSTHIDDASLQQFVSAKTNRPIGFSYETATIDGVVIGIVRIEAQERPCYLKKDFGKLRADTVYIRRGSATFIADPTEIRRMGAIADSAETKLRFDENLKVNLKGYGAGIPEPMHLAIELTIINIGLSPVFISSAKVFDRSGTRTLTFQRVCDDNSPLQPGGRRSETLTLLPHSPFRSQPRPQDILDSENRFAYELLRFVCQNESTFQIETGRGTRLSFPAPDVCDANFLGWPSLATPLNILQELGSKSLEDFEATKRAAFEKAGWMRE